MTNSSPLTRRNWLGLISTASLGPGLLATAGAAEPAMTSKAGNDLGARIYNIRDFGAKGDGKTLDTAALQAAIEACHKDQGGTVLVPAGMFVIGTTELKSNVRLHIVAGGTLLGSADGKQYHAVDAIPLHGDSTLEDGNVALLFAVNAENVSVDGPGMIDGQGSQFRSPTRGVPPPSGIGGARRPYHLLFHKCTHLTVRDIYLKASAFHSVRIIQSQHVKLDGIHIYNRVNHNNDGFHFISCQHVHLSNSTVICQDDACALFGSCKFITVTNCTFSTRWSVFRFGGGEAENISVSNCLIYETYGCPIKMRCGPRSRFENISFSNLVMKDVTGPVSIGSGPSTRRQSTPEDTNAPPAEAEMPTNPGLVRNISFSGLQVTVAKPVPLPDSEFVSNYNPGEVFSCITLNGVGEHIIENISFNGVHVTFPGGGTAEQAGVRDVPKVVGEYYAIGVPPAHALFARNVRGLTLQDVRFQLAAPDLRPAVVFDHVHDAAVNGFSVQGSPEAESLLRFIETQEVLLTGSRALAPAKTFLQVEGAGSGDIVVDGGDISKAAAPVAFKDGASEKAAKVRA